MLVVPYCLKIQFCDCLRLREGPAGKKLQRRKKPEVSLGEPISGGSVGHLHQFVPFQVLDPIQNLILSQLQRGLECCVGPRPKGEEMVLIYLIEHLQDSQVSLWAKIL